MKYLITGGCGFLGSNLSEEVLKRGDELCVFDNLSRLGSLQNLEWLKGKGNFLFTHGDIRNAWDVERIIKDFHPDVIFHLAGQVAMTTSLANPRLDFEVNALGTLNVLEAVRLNAPEGTIIYSSTNKVYGDLEWVNYEETETRYIAPDYPEGFDETLSLDFHSPYGCSKGAADQYMLDYARMFDLKTVVFRHSSMYGGRQFSTYDQGWVGWFCQKAAEARAGNKEPFAIFGSGKQVRDVLRGMHFQLPPRDHVKLVYVTAGEILDVAVGIRSDLPEFGKYFSTILSHENAKSIYIAKGYAHGFLTLSDEATVVYLTSTVHAPEFDTGIRWNSFGFDWGINTPLLSERDQHFLPLHEGSIA